ncbi:LacI family DNA-binding transcriptional regulator [Streptomyces sp. TS71-3]|uniref:LacI family DNA-binding transcriptional regulator n=1 Tax=Streptomyces sp. TS71-3 TaxID=2733862 RepID=UPI001B267E89|nr:LacI family DNA-binding transcriptional regulator [Streptomyces sp. TS71-3]GHJ36975.1 LacI family transcriptional regulator [Streptomyces sp. TS71-3]
MRTGKPPTRADVARLAGTSTAVVSYVVNDGPRPVAAATRERVVAAIEELDYRPNAVARALRTQETQTVAMLVPDISNPFFAEFAQAVQDSAFEQGKVLLIGDSGGDDERETAYLRRFLDQQVEGIVFIGARRGSSLRTVTDAGVPAVVLDRPLDGSGHSFVGIDNAAAAGAATRHLIEHGHRRIACVAGPGDQRNAADRLAGWRTALEESGIAPDPALVHVDDFSVEGGVRAGRALLTTAAPDAVFVSSDSQTEGLLAVAHRLGLTVPGDLAVFGFDGTRRSAYSDPAMSVVEQPVKAAAQRALDLLASAAPEHVLLDFTLAVRRSCGCAADPGLR